MNSMDFVVDEVLVEKIVKNVEILVEPDRIKEYAKVLSEKFKEIADSKS